MKICPYCEKELEDSAKFCNYCGAAMEEPRQEKPKKEKMPKPEKEKKKAGKGRTIGIILLVLLLVGLLAAGAVLAVKLCKRETGNEAACAFFLKDDQLFYTDYQHEPLQITEALLPREPGEDDESYLMMLNWPLSYLERTQDGRFVFCPDHVERNAEDFSLYCRSLTDPDAEPVLIGEHVSSYALQAKTNLAYVIGTDGTLCRVTPQGEKTEIDTGAGYLHCPETPSETLYYDKQDGTLCRLGQDAAAGEVIAEGVTQVIRVSDDGSTIWYQKNKTLCKNTDGTETTVAENVDAVYRTYDDGSAYYTRENWEERPLYDFVQDDNPTGEGEELVPGTMPLVPDYPDAPVMPDPSAYENEGDYQAALQQYNQDYQTYLSDYNKANEELMEKQAEYLASGGMVNPLNEMREELKKETVSVPVCSVLYFDGREEKELSSAFDGEYLFAAPDAKVAVFGAFCPEKLPKMPLGQIDAAEDAAAWYYEKRSENYTFWVAAGSDAKEVWQDGYVIDRVTGDGQVCFFPASDGKEDETAVNTFRDVTYYLVPTADGKVGEKEVLAEHVDGGGFGFTKDTPPAFITFTGSEDALSGTLYIDGEKVDEDVFMYSVESQSGTTAYLKDYDADSYLAALMLDEKGEKTLLCERVKDFKLQEDGSLLYLGSDGVLSLLKDGKTTQIADGVSGFEKY